MSQLIPIVEDESVPDGMVFLLPPIRPVVYYPQHQPGPTVEQELTAIMAAVYAAALAGQSGVIRCQD